MNQQIVNLIVLHLSDPALSLNLEFYRDKHPEEYEQARQKAADNDNYDDSRETRKS